MRRYTGGVPSPEVFERGFNDDLALAATDYGFRTVIERASGAHVGDCGLIQKTVESQPEVEVVYFFNARPWGRGLARPKLLAPARVRDARSASRASSR